MRPVVKAVDLCASRLCAFQPMVKQCRGQAVTGGNEQVCVVSPVLNELLPKASFICM